MISGADNISLELSLIDKKLNDLMPLSTFITADEYRDIHDKIESWHSRIPYLKDHIFNDKKLDLSKVEKNKFPIKLFSTIPNHTIFDIVATIPIEFQYINTIRLDIIVLRMDLGDGRYNISIIEINDNVLDSIQNFYEKIISSKKGKDEINPFEKAYFSYIHENGRYILNSKKEIFSSWNEFHNEFQNNYNLDIKEYSNTGRYLWQRDYILLDNRAYKNYKVYLLEDQWNDTKKTTIEEVETLIVPEKKDNKSLFDISALYIDKDGNYWSSKEAYQKYCNFLNI